MIEARGRALRCMNITPRASRRTLRSNNLQKIVLKNVFVRYAELNHGLSMPCVNTINRRDNVYH